MLMADKTKFLEADSFCRNRYNRALNELYHYFDENHISTYYFCTDPLAAYLELTDEHPMQATADMGDLFFLRQRGLISGNPTMKLPADIAEKMRKKFPVEKGMNDLQRLTIVDKRVRFCERELMARAKAIVVFGTLYKPRTSENDGRAIIYVDWRQCIPKLKLSGHDAIIEEFMDLKYANLAISEWGKYRGE